MSPFSLLRPPAISTGHGCLVLLVLVVLAAGAGDVQGAVQVGFPGPIAFNLLGDPLDAVAIDLAGEDGQILVVGTSNGWISLVRFFPGVENFSVLQSINVGGQVTWVGHWPGASAPGVGIAATTANPDQLFLLTILSEEPYFNILESVDLPEDPGSLVFVGEEPDGAGEAAVSLPGVDQVVIVRETGDDWIISQTLGTGDTPQTLAALDLDDDGTLEFVSGDRGVLSGSVGIFRRDGPGAFRLASHHPLPGGVGPLAAFDCTDDPGLEIVAASSDSTWVHILTWEADDLVERERVDVTLPAADIQAARLHDGSLGLHTTVGYRGLAEFYRRDGGPWERVDSFYPGCHPVAVTTCDFNADGLLDMVCLGKDGHSGTALFGNTAPSYWGFHALALNSVPGPSVLADFNGDGRHDLLVAGYNKPMFSIFPGVPGGGFNISPLEQQLPFFAGTMVSLDVDGDDLPELAVSDLLSGRIQIMTYSAADSFAAFTSLDPAMVPASIEHADLDQDGHEDIFLARPGPRDIFIAFGDGTGEFPDVIQLPVLTGAAGVLDLDLNADGRPDLFVADGMSRGWTFLNQGGRVFVEGSWVNLGAAPREMVACDLDGDLDPDVTVANRLDHSLTFLENDGSGTLRLRIGSHALNAEPVGIAGGDIDQNGFTDLLVNQRGEGGIGVIYGLGDWIFSPVNLYTGGVNITDFQVADFNEDGVLDVLSLDQTLQLGLVMLNQERTLVAVDPTALSVDCVDGRFRLAVTPDRAGPWSVDLVRGDRRVLAAADGVAWAGDLDFDGGTWFLSLAPDDLVDAGLPADATGLTVRLTVGYAGEREVLDLSLDRACGGPSRGGPPPALTWDRQPWPNPFNPLVKCRITLAHPSRVEAVIHDTAGRRVAVLMADDLPAGAHELIWDGRRDGRPAAAGLYLLRVRTADSVLSSKLMLLK